MLGILEPSAGKCVICGGKAEGNEDYVCNMHRIEILQKFLVGKALMRLRNYVDKVVQKSCNQCIDYFLQFFPISMYAEVGTDIDKIGYEELSLLSNKSSFLSYVLLRLCQSLPSLSDRAYELASRSTGRSQVRTRYDTEFLEALLSEFEFFYALYWGVQGLYGIAADSDEKPSKIAIIPKETQEAALKTFMLRVRDSESVYRCSLYPIIHESSLECLYDENGAFFCYERNQIKERFELFNNLWSRMFGSTLPISPKEYLDFMFFFKFVVCPFGFTRKQKNKAYNLADYKELDEETVFRLLDMILPEVCSQVDVISTKSLGKKDSNYRTVDKLNRLAWAFRFSSQSGTCYFIPVVDWLHNVLSPVLARFGRTLNVAGTFYEDWIDNAIRAFASGLLGFQFTNDFGYIPVRQAKPKKEAATDWRILERNMGITVETGNAQATVEAGEIDLIVYANYNIYMLELKSMNLSGKKAVRYLNRKAPLQCSRYASWARKRENIRALLTKHSIPEDKVNSVRILCCTNGVYNKTSIINSKSGEEFAVLPLFMLFNLFAGVFTLSIRNMLPSCLMGIKNGLMLAFPSLKDAYLVDNSGKLNETANAIVQDWHALMMFDRRQDFQCFEKRSPGQFNLARFFVHREVYIGNTANWILGKPVELATVNGIRYFVGTQIAAAGTTMLCAKCNSAIKYYYAPTEDKNSEVRAIIGRRSCPFCRQRLKVSSENTEVVSNMSASVLAFREKLDSDLLSKS